MFFSPYYFRPQPDVGEICYPDGTCITVGQGAGGTPPRPPVKPRPPIQIDPPIHQAPGGFPIPSGMPGGMGSPPWTGGTSSQGQNGDIPVDPPVPVGGTYIPNPFDPSPTPGPWGPYNFRY
ncbi:hypothetical protein D9C08_23225 (plasmid) [Bacillus subtilis subsp. subtilis]|nr:hypothetical protein D9C08_23225 [Bacillus subtilis subsp. subtilis]MCB4338717.1 hypothetical protein [Bacillus subtilis]